MDKHGRLARGADDLLRKIILNTDTSCYWLTTRCKGNVRPVLNTLQPLLNQDTAQLIELVKPTNWRTLKTESIDFKNSFKWLDDSPMHAELRVLEQNGVSDSIVLIDLKSNPDNLRDVVI